MIWQVENKNRFFHCAFRPESPAFPSLPLHVPLVYVSTLSLHPNARYCLFKDSIDTVATLADPNELFLPGDRQNNLAMSSVPLLRTPVPSPQRNNGTPRAPKLTLGIPPSPNAKPVNGNGVPAMVAPPQPQPASSRPALRLATPMINPNAPQPVNRMANGRPGPPSLALSTGGLGVNSQPMLKTNGGGSNPISANSSVSTADIARGLRESGGSDPASAISSFDGEGNDQLEGENGVSALGFDLDRLSLEKGRPLDVEDLDDKGWHAASEQKKIIELGSLGEGAGGAVTRCQLKDGKTVFALKVCSSAHYLYHDPSVINFLSP